MKQQVEIERWILEGAVRSKRLGFMGGGERRLEMQSKTTSLTGTDHWIEVTDGGDRLGFRWMTWFLDKEEGE